MVLISLVLFYIISLCKGFNERTYEIATDNKRYTNNYITINANELSTIPLIEPLYYDEKYYKFYSSGEEIKIQKYEIESENGNRFYPFVGTNSSIPSDNINEYIKEIEAKQDYCIFQGFENETINFIYLDLYDIINFGTENVGIDKHSNYVVYFQMTDDLHIGYYNYIRNYEGENTAFKCKRLIKTREENNNQYYFGISDDSSYIYIFRESSFDRAIRYNSLDITIVTIQIYNHYIFIVTNSTIEYFSYDYEYNNLASSIPIPENYQNIRDCIIANDYIMYLIVEGYGLMILNYSLYPNSSKWYEVPQSSYKLIKFEGIYYTHSNPFTLGAIAKTYNNSFYLIDLLITHQNQMNPTVYDSIEISNRHRNNTKVEICTDFINKRTYIYNGALLVINRNLPRMKEPFYISNELFNIKKIIIEEIYNKDKEDYEYSYENEDIIQLDNITLLSSYISFGVKDSIRLVLSPISFKQTLRCNFRQDGLYLQNFTLYEDCSQENKAIYCSQENSDSRCQNDYVGYIYELKKCPIEFTYYINVISRNSTVQIDINKLNKYKRAFWSILGLLIAVLVIIIFLLVLKLIEKRKKEKNKSHHEIPNKSEPNIQLNDLQKETYHLKIDDPIALNSDFKEKP